MIWMCTFHIIDICVNVSFRLGGTGRRSARRGRRHETYRISRLGNGMAQNRACHSILQSQSCMIAVPPCNNVKDMLCTDGGYFRDHDDSVVVLMHLDRYVHLHATLSGVHAVSSLWSRCAPLL